MSKLNNLERKLFIVFLVALLVLSVLFPIEGEGIRENVYMFGFPDTFLTVYSRAFLYRSGSDSRFQFTFELLQFAINVCILGGLSFFMCKIPAMIVKIKACFAKCRQKIKK